MKISNPEGIIDVGKETLFAEQDYRTYKGVTQRKLNRSVEAGNKNLKKALKHSLLLG